MWATHLLALSMGEHSRNSDTMIFIYLQKLPRCSLKFLPFWCVALIRDKLEMKKKHSSRMHVFGIHVHIGRCVVQLCFCAPSIYGDFIAVAAGQSDIFYNSFEVMELAMDYHYTKYVAVLNRIEEPTPKYMVDLFISC